MKIQNTSYNNFIKDIFASVSQVFSGPWRYRSIALLSLLIGYYFSSTTSSYFLVESRHRITVVFFLFLILEFTVRSRKLLINTVNKYTLIIIDNLRIGFFYAIVLEAFKLGSK